MLGLSRMWETLPFGERMHKERSPCGQLVSQQVLVCYLLLCPVVVQGRVRQLLVIIADVQGT
jgi:hypothetical protein